MAKDKVKEVTKEELENKEEETKELENDQAEDNQEDENSVENPPANVDNEKKGFHPIKAVRDKLNDFGEKHPKVVNGVKTVGKVGTGVVIGTVGTVAVLASVAKNRADDDIDDERDDDEDDDIVDSVATELEDDQE